MPLTVTLLVLVLLYSQETTSCLTRSYTYGSRGRPGISSNREPVIYRQYLPNRSEQSISASGPAEGRITRSSPRFSDLVENHNTDIVFKDDEGTGADRTMSKKCKDKLDSLAIMVMNQWPGIKLRVIDAWEENGGHPTNSLHYEGRAVDISTSDRDKRKLPLLARLAYNAGFDYVYYESKRHIHCSVKSDKPDEVYGKGGCFSSRSVVTMEDGRTKPITELRVHDRVLSASAGTGSSQTDVVIMLMDIDREAIETFIKISFSEGYLEVTPYHLVYARQLNSTLASQEFNAIYAKDISADHVVLVSTHEGLQQRAVLYTEQITARGLYAPITLSGNIIVNGMVVSCYSLIDSHWLAHIALLPYRLYYHIFASNVTSMEWFYPSEERGIHPYGDILSKLFAFLL